jgi:8-oxo-dGTP pyrophosphatase MutT (NUDIX family)
MTSTGPDAYPADSPGSPGSPEAASGSAAPAGPGDAVPGWLAVLAEAAGQMPVPPGLRPPPGGGRHSAILILFGEGDHGPDVLLVQRSNTLRRHAGQPAFPGGVIDAGDGGPVGAALREAAEEALVDPAGVDVVAVLPDLYITRTGYRVSPVLAWWRKPGPVAPGDPAEVAAVARVPVADLADPRRRLMIRYPSGVGGPAFQAGEMLVWGFTAFVLDRLLAMGGWERPWDSTAVTDLPRGTELTGIDGPDPAG